MGEIAEKITTVLVVEEDRERFMLSESPSSGRSRPMVVMNDGELKESMLKALGDYVRDGGAREPAHLRVVEFGSRKVLDEIFLEAAPPKPEPEPTEAKPEEEEAPKCPRCGTGVIFDGSTQQRQPPSWPNAPAFAVWSCSECSVVAQVGDGQPLVVDFDTMDQLPPAAIFVAGAAASAALEKLRNLEMARAVGRLAKAFEKAAAASTPAPSAPESGT